MKQLHFVLLSSWLVLSGAVHLVNIDFSGREGISVVN